MALDKGALQTLIEAKVTEQGFDINNDHSFFKVISKAVAEAVVEHIISSSEVIVAGGGSYGGETTKVT